MAGKIAEVRLATAADLAAWQDFVDRRPDAGCMHHAGWFSVLRDAFNVQMVYLLAVNDAGGIQGVLPAYFSSSALAGRCITSLEDGILAANADAAHALVAEVRAQRGKFGAQYLQLRGGATDDAPCLAIPTVRTVIPTGRSCEALWAAVKKKTRWAIRRAETAGIVVEHDSTLSAFEEFYFAYARRLRDLGTPVVGWRAFAAIRTHLGRERLRLYVVKYLGHVIGGMLCVINGERWTDLYAAAQVKAETEFANYLLYWRAIRDASTLGATRFDLGRSTPGSGVHLFKRKWGGVDVEVPYRFYPAPGANPRDMGLQRMKQEKGFLQHAWSHLPLSVANRLGPRLRRRLPFI